MVEPKISRSVYKGLIMKQAPNTLNAFDWFFTREKFDYVIEIGTLPGGFSLYLLDKSLEMSAGFYTFDLNELNEDVKELLLSNGANVFIEDANESRIIRELLLGPYRVLILNDGDKMNFFSKIVKLLKVDDVIITHDYGFEWQFEDVEEYIAEYNLDILYSDIFSEYMWFCCVKSINGEII